jgi:CBS domain-containing protein
MNIVGTIDSILREKGTQTWTISPEATVYEAIHLMAEKNIGALLVMEGEQLIGIISERDYTRKVALKGKSSRQTAVRELVSTPVITIERGDTVEECMRLMTEHRVRHLPVMEGSRVVGVVSIGDLVNWTISAQHLAISQMEDYISGKYPG